MFERILFPLSDSRPFYYVSTALQFMSPVPAISFCISSFTHTHTYIYSYIERFVFVFLTFFFSFYIFLSTHKKVKKNENKLKSNMHAHTKRLMCSKMLYIAAPCVNQGLILCVSVHIFLMHNWINNVGHLVNIIINHFGPSFFSTLLLFCCRLKSLNMINEATFIFVCS